MAKKVVTKIECVQVGFYVSGLVDAANITGNAPDGALAWHEDRWEGKWHVQDFSVYIDDRFDIWARRWKHQDGRIRDSASGVDGALAFALYCIEHYPTAHPLVSQWAIRMLDPSSLAFTVKTKEEKRFIREQVREHGAPTDVAGAQALIVAAALCREAV